MIANQLQRIIDSGEGLSVEFKACRNRLSRDVYETICAFLNRQGGHLVLGVKDDGTVSGIDPAALAEIKSDLVVTLNNPQKINPPLYALPENRDDIRTNLIESYDRLMAFAAKHLPDSFHLEKDQRISLREHIFREVAANILIHREFLSAFPAKFIIENQRVKTENANRPHGHGMINPADFTPYPKNPIIARFFKEIGRADELGSGVRKLFKYTRIYSGGNDPQLIEADIFKILIPTAYPATEQAAGQATEQATEQALGAEQISQLISFCRKPRTSKEIMDFLGLKHREHFRSEILNPLISQKKLFLLFPDKPTSPKQKYYSR